jgi:hypothetical protein
LFACLGLLSGPFDAAAAAAVSGKTDEAAVLERLLDLTEQSMLEIRPGATPRFHLLQIVREYALARLAESGAEEVAQRRLLVHGLGERGLLSRGHRRPGLVPQTLRRGQVPDRRTNATGSGRQPGGRCPCRRVIARTDLVAVAPG